MNHQFTAMTSAIYMLLLVASSSNVNASLILHYDFDGDVIDVTGHGNDGTITGSPAFVPAELDQGLFFNNPIGSVPATEFVTIPYTTDMQRLESSSFTVGIKYWSTDTGQQNGRIAGHNPFGFDYNAVSRPTAAAGVDGVVLYDESNPQSYTTDGNLHWQIVVVDRVENRFDFYVDSNLIDSGTVSSSAVILLDDITRTYRHLAGRRKSRGRLLKKVVSE